MSDTLIVAILVFVAVSGALLSFAAWRRLGRRPPEPGEGEMSQFDSDDPDV